MFQTRRLRYIYFSYEFFMSFATTQRRPRRLFIFLIICFYFRAFLSIRFGKSITGYTEINPKTTQYNALQINSFINNCVQRSWLRCPCTFRCRPIKRQCYRDVWLMHYHWVVAASCFVAKSIGCRDQLWMMDLKVLAVAATDLAMASPMETYQMRLPFDRWGNWFHRFQATISLAPNAHANTHATFFGSFK